MSKLIILGGGGYGQVAREVALSTEKYKRVDFLDDNNPEAIGKFADYEKFVGEYDGIFIALGNPSLRREWSEKIKKAGFRYETLISPKSFVSPSAKIGEGVIVEPMAIVNTAAMLGEGVLICAGACVNHNAVVGNFCQIDCGAVIGAGATVPENTKIKHNEVIYKN
ncbi:MAG: PglB [Clostridia bacterium]|nr:PglB [Clostridia bacterium]